MHNISEFYNKSEVLNENTYIIKIEMVDGSSQLLQVTKEQALMLGIEFSEISTDKQISNNVSPAPDDIEEIDLNIVSILDKTKDVKTKYNYKVIQPEDLNLRPNNPVPPLALPRGRPKKRPIEVTVQEKPITPPKIFKPARTRSGRITRPPVHMKKHFAKIVIEEGKNELKSSFKDLSTKEFEPLKTNNVPLINTDNINPPTPEKKKRPIPSQYRCSTCNKAYLGRNRMAQHLKTHSDHGLISQLKEEDCDTWSCLVETSLKAKEGNRGSKFCKEIANLIRNARTLVKYFFKPAKTGRVDYCVDAILSSILNIKEGNYRFNENELCKDVSIFSFLEYFDENFADHIIKLDEKQKPLEQTVNKDIEENIHFESDLMHVIKENSGDDKNDGNAHKANLLMQDNLLHDKNKADFNLFETDVYTNKSKEKDNFIIDKTLFENEAKILDDPKVDHNDFTNLFDDPNFFNGDKSKEDSLFQLNSAETKCSSKTVNKADFNNLFNCHDIFTEKKSESSAKNEDKIGYNAIFEYSKDDDAKKNVSKMYAKEGKEVDIYRNIIPNILSIGASDEHMIELLGQKDKIESKDIFDGKQPDYTLIDKKCKKDAFDMHKLHLLSGDISDELIMPDPGPVSNILDTSLNSDDIMNVDQFVNERFKKLTEADVVLPNTTLSLDLPTLECFSFSSG